MDLAEKTEQLSAQLAEANDEAKQARLRLETLGRQAAARHSVVEALSEQLTRTAGSRSFRYGHRLFRGLALLTFRRPKRRTALDAAAETLRATQRRVAEDRRSAGATAAPT